MDKIREVINPLASDEHLHELMQQLELMGEVVLEGVGTDQDLVCYQPEWLCGQILGRIFSHDRYYQVNPNNLNGVYTSNEISSVFSDICNNTRLLRDIFTGLDLCAELDNEKTGEPLYEFASLNFLSEPLPLSFHTVNSSAKINKQTNFVFNGFLIKTSSFHLDKSSRQSLMNSSMTSSSIFLTPTQPASQLASLFFRIQVNLRYLTKNFYLEFDENIEENQKRILKEKQQQPQKASSPIVQKETGHPRLTRNQSKLDTLFETPQSPQSPNQSVTGFFTNHHHHHNHHHSSLANLNGSLIDVELYQTRYCSRLTRKSCRIECLLSLEHKNGRFIEIRACAPEQWREELFYFVNDLYSFVEQIVSETCPSINLEKHYLSFKPVSVPNSNPALNLGLVPIEKIYHPKEVLSLQLESLKSKNSKFLDLVCCGSENIEKNLILGVDLSLSQLRAYSHKMLCFLLDKKDPMGLDWTILAVKLGLQNLMPKIDELVEIKGSKISKTECVLHEWMSQGKQETPTIRNLIYKIKDLGRNDVLDLLMSTIDLFQLNISKDSGIQNSNQTLASLK